MAGILGTIPTTPRWEGAVGRWSAHTTRCLLAACNVRARRATAFGVEATGGRAVGGRLLARPGSELASDQRRLRRRTEKTAAEPVGGCCNF